MAPKMHDLLRINLDIRLRAYAVIVLVICTTIYMIYQNLNDQVWIIWGTADTNIMCHYSTEGDALPSAEAPGFAPAPRSIFFHETSCDGGLDSRQACAVESAARAHPQREVHVLFSAPVSDYALNHTCIAKLLEFHNVKLARVHIEQYCENTPISRTLLQNLMYSDDLKEKTAEILRIVTLNKYGGIYLGMDMLVVKSLEPLGLNWIVKLSEEETLVSALAFDNDEALRTLTDIMMMKISTLYVPMDRIYADPDIIHLVMDNICRGVFNSSANKCEDIKIYPKEMFIPVPSVFWYAYYDARDLDDMEAPYTHCTWSKMAQNHRIHKLSPYARLAKKHCPTIYEMYGDQFGD